MPNISGLVDLCSGYSSYISGLKQASVTDGLAFLAECRKDAALQDPYRLFREVYQISASYVTFGILSAKDYCLFQWFTARSWLQRKREGGVRRRSPSASTYVN